MNPVRTIQVAVCANTPDHVVGFGEGLAVVVWRHQTDAGDVSGMETAARRAHQAAKHQVGLIQVVAPSAIAPDGPARAALAVALRQLGGIVSHSAIVHEAVGFRAAMIRSIVTGIATLSNPGYPHRVFATVREAADWMSRGNERLDAQRIVSVVARVRAEIPGAGVAAGATPPERTA